MPTRNRATTAYRAALSFLDALNVVGTATSVRLVIIDDSDLKEEADAIHLVADQIRAVHADVVIEDLASQSVGAHKFTVAVPQQGPGAVRNRGLKYLRAGPADNDVTIFFDDDVCFRDLEYRSVHLNCDGVQLLRDALERCATPNAVVGCGYVGRQDLSILEHIQLNTGRVSTFVEPAIDRNGIESVAPGGISTAFLAVKAPAHRLPDFPDHYNEDYVWLHALDRAGWPLQRVVPLLAHAPPGGVSVNPAALSFQIFGEIVWLAVSEQERFPPETPTTLAAAIDEIIGDVREVIAKIDAKKWPVIAKILDDARQHYEAVRDATAVGRPGEIGIRLKRAIMEGLALQPKA